MSPFSIDHWTVLLKNFNAISPVKPSMKHFCVSISPARKSQGKRSVSPVSRVPFKRGVPHSRNSRPVNRVFITSRPAKKLEWIENKFRASRRGEWWWSANGGPRECFTTNFLFPDPLVFSHGAPNFARGRKLLICEKSILLSPLSAAHSRPPLCSCSCNYAQPLNSSATFVLFRPCLVEMAMPEPLDCVI